MESQKHPSGVFTDHIFRRVVSLITVTAFVVTNGYYAPAAFSEVQPYVSAANQAAPAKMLPSDLSTVKIPPSIGNIEETFTGSQHQTVILIQDAHGVPDAQRNIQKMIGHFQSEYGIRRIAFEGAASELDGRLFRSFPDREALQRTLDVYFDAGELTGTTAAAVLNPAGAVYRGIENWKLYERGLACYQYALSREKQTETFLSGMRSELNHRKAEVYSSELFKLDQALEAFDTKHEGLADLLKALARIRKPEKDSELALLLEDIDREEKGGPASGENEIARLAATLRRYLAHSSREGTPDKTPRQDDLRLFNESFQQFQTGGIAPEIFAGRLEQWSRKYALPVGLSGELGRLKANRERLEKIQSAGFFRELNRYTRQVKEALFRSEEERRLDQESRRLALFEKLAKLELSRSEWDELQELTSYSLVLSSDFAPHLAFYENALQRDEIFSRNLAGMMRKNHGGPVVFVAGGFHAQGLIHQFRKKGISCVLVSPVIGDLPDTAHYREQMLGKVSWQKYFRIENGKVDLYKAFVRAMRDKLLSADEMRLLKTWRDQIVRDFNGQKQITKAGHYTAFLDEASRNQHTVKPRWQINYDRFVNGLRRLEARGALNEQNILKLLRPRPAMMGAPAPQAALAAGTLLDARLANGQGAEFAATFIPRRSEARVASFSPAEEYSFEDLPHGLARMIQRVIESEGQPVTVFVDYRGEEITFLKLPSGESDEAHPIESAAQLLTSIIRSKRDNSPGVKFLVRRQGNRVLVTRNIPVFGGGSGGRAEARREVTLSDIVPMYVMNKPLNVVSDTVRHPEIPDVPTILELLPPDLPGRAELNGIGRLDRFTSGLSLFGRGGVYVTALLNPTFSPDHRVSKIYEAVVYGTLKDEDIAKLLSGVEYSYKTRKKSGKHVWLQHTGKALSAGEPQGLTDPATSRPLTKIEITIDEGRFHQVRFMFDGIGHPVKELKRISFGEIKLGDLAPGQVRELTPEEYDWVLKTVNKAIRAKAALGQKGEIPPAAKTEKREAPAAPKSESKTRRQLPATSLDYYLFSDPFSTKLVSAATGAAVAYLFGLWLGYWGILPAVVYCVFGPHLLLARAVYSRSRDAQIASELERGNFEDIWFALKQLEWLASPPSDSGGLLPPAGNFKKSLDQIVKRLFESRDPETTYEQRKYFAENILGFFMLDRFASRITAITVLKQLLAICEQRFTEDAAELRFFLLRIAGWFLSKFDEDEVDQANELAPLVWRLLQKEKNRQPPDLPDPQIVKVAEHGLSAYGAGLFDFRRDMPASSTEAGMPSVRELIDLIPAAGAFADELTESSSSESMNRSVKSRDEARAEGPRRHQPAYRLPPLKQEVLPVIGRKVDTGYRHMTAKAELETLLPGYFTALLQAAQDRKPVRMNLRMVFPYRRSGTSALLYGIEIRGTVDRVEWLRRRLAGQL